MRKTLFFAVSMLLLCSLPGSAEDQKHPLRTLEFVGATGYSQAELMAAAHLKPGDALTTTEMDEHARVLLDTGLFDAINFNFNGLDLTYTVKLSSELLPVVLPNLPPIAGLDMEQQLRARIPLYHGRVPVDGGLREELLSGMEQILAEHGLQASVTAAANANSATHAVNYLLAAPSVVIGTITPSAALPAEARAALQKLEGQPFDNTGSATQIATWLANYYHDHGYLEVSTLPQMASQAEIATEQIRVPFTVTVTAGPQYRLANIHLDPALLETQQEFDHAAPLHAGEIAGGQALTKCWIEISRAYRKHGYMRAEVHPEAHYDHAAATVSFTVTATPGPVYTMGKLNVQNSDELRDAIRAAWSVKEGAPFDDTALQRLLATGNTNKDLARVFAKTNLRYSVTLNDATHTVDVTLRLERKNLP